MNLLLHFWKTVFSKSVHENIKHVLNIEHVLSEVKNVTFVKTKMRRALPLYDSVDTKHVCIVPMHPLWTLDTVLIMTSSESFHTTFCTTKLSPLLMQRKCLIPIALALSLHVLTLQWQHYCRLQGLHCNLYCSHSRSPTRKHLFSKPAVIIFL